MSSLVLRELCKNYHLQGSCVVALKDINLLVSEGQFVTIVGRSGCGKTTLLKILGGIERATSGEVVFQGSNTKVGMVFQEARLMPWLTVEKNMGFSLSSQNEELKQSIVDKYLTVLGLTKFKDAYPAQISGGMAQRVALGRSLCFNSDIILMDEPLSALDAFTRRKMQDELIQLFVNTKKTVLFVTHDVDEALLLGNKVVVMEKGKIIAEIQVPMGYPRNTATKEFYIVRQKILSLILQCDDEGEGIS